MDDILEKKKQDNDSKIITKKANLKIFISSIFFLFQFKIKTLNIVF